MAISNLRVKHEGTLTLQGDCSFCCDIPAVAATWACLGGGFTLLLNAIVVLVDGGRAHCRAVVRRSESVGAYTASRPTYEFVIDPARRCGKNAGTVAEGGFPSTECATEQGFAAC